MKKLFTNLLLAVLLNGFISAAPTNCICLAKVPNISKTFVSADYEIREQKKAAFDIYPYDILVFKFN